MQRVFLFGFILNKKQICIKNHKIMQLSTHYTTASAKLLLSLSEVEPTLQECCCGKKKCCKSYKKSKRCKDCPKG